MKKNSYTQSLTSQNFKRKQFYTKYLSRLILAITCLSCMNFSYAQTPAQALEFNAAGNNYIQLPQIITSGSYTKEAWINPTSNDLTGFPNVLTGSQTALFLNNGVLTAGHGHNFLELGDTTAIPLVPGTWYHIAVTFDSVANELKLYKNGILVGDTIDVTLAYVNETPLAISLFSGANYWDGEIDEVSIWNVPLTVSQITGNMNCKLTGDEPNLLAYYSFNQGTASGSNTGVTTLIDSSDKCTAYNGTLMNFTLTTGTTSNWVSPGAPISSACANIYPNIDVTGNATCITSGENTPSFSDSTDFDAFITTPVTKTFIVSNTGGADLTISSVTITGADASDFAVTATPSSSIAVSGSSNLAITFSPTGSLGEKTAIVTINNNDGDEGTFTFAIQGNYAGPGKALAFHMFDGNYVSIQNITLSGSYTKEAWINPTAASLSNLPNIVTGTGTALLLNNGVLGAGHSSNFLILSDTTGVPLVAGTWYHVAATYDSAATELKLYKNGILVGDTIDAVLLPYTETTLAIGTFDAGHFWDGDIDEVSIWNTVRTQAQIAAGMNCQLTGDEPGLIAYYNFTSGIAGGNNAGDTVLQDLSHKCQVYNGILHNFELTGTSSNWVTDTLAPTTCPGTYPNIGVTGNAVCIADKDAITTTLDNTYFGVATTGTIFKTFVIQNNGSATLTIDSAKITGADSLDFIIVTPPAGNILPGGSVTIVVAFLPLAIGTRDAELNIYSNDSGKAIFSYAIEGTGTIILPVSLQSFAGRIDGAVTKLTWKTSAEINNKGYNILRSADGVSNWIKIGYVAASGSGVASVYNFTDASPLHGVNSYRLQQIDESGDSKFSTVITVDFGAKGSVIALYPNPVKSKVTISFSDSKLLNTPVRLTTVAGTLIQLINLTANNQQFDLSRLPQGVYLLSFSNGDVTKVIKQ